MGPLIALDLVDGAVPTAAALLAVPAGVFLLARRWRRGALIPLLAAVLAAGVAWAAGQWATASGLSTHPLPVPVLAWIAAAACALILAGAGLRRAPWLRRLLAPVAAVLVLAAAALQVNAYYGFYRTLGDVTGATTADIAPLTSTSHEGRAAAPPLPLADWAPPPDMPEHGRVRTAHIPGTVSGFAARKAYVYLPPAHEVPRHPVLPVLVLIPGQPGSPADWLTAGRLQPVLDAFAAAHRGLAPIAVVVDANGALTANTLCMDSRIARADTYLATDVPAWIAANLDAATDHARWAIGGFSFGGTCAIQMATVHPRTYPNVLDFSGEAEPSLGPSRTATIQASFAGDSAAFEALTPLHRLRAHHYPRTWAYFAAGAGDQEFTGCMHTVSGAASRAGMRVETKSVPGSGHSWSVAAAALAPALEWFSRRLDLAP